MKFGVVNTALVDVKGLVQNVTARILFPVPEDEISLLHAQTTMVSLKRFHARDDITHPDDVDKKQGTDMVGRETHPTWMMRNVHVRDKMARQSSRACRVRTISMVLCHIEMTTTSIRKPFLEFLLGISNINFVTKTTGSPVDRAVATAGTSEDAVPFSETVTIGTVADFRLIEVTRQYTFHDLRAEVIREEFVDVGKPVVSYILVYTSSYVLYIP